MKPLTMPMLVPVLVAASAVAGKAAFLPVSDRPIWGFTHGIQVGIYPAALGTRGDGGPRGLLRIGYLILPDGASHLVNFVAVEPTVNGRKGFSELEAGADGRQGKRLTSAGVRQKALPHGNQLQVVTIQVERFENGAHVRLELRFRSNRPNEVELAAFAEPDSTPIQECVLTATMGNYERVRQVWLRNGPVESSSLYPAYSGRDFAPDRLFPLLQLCAGVHNGVTVPFTTNEPDPRVSQDSLPEGLFWRYPGIRVTQYWRAPKGSYSPALRLRVNARRVYWRTNTPLPGGIAFENVELRDRFRSGQPFIFGIAPAAPQSLLRNP